MLITRKFVMINFPKTGSTFARTAILKLHPKENEGLLVRLGLKEPSVKELIMPQLFFTDLQRASNPIPEQHAGYVQLPRKYRDRTIMTVMRVPPKIAVDPVGFPVREPMLAEGKVDAVTGFSFTSSLSAERLGVPLATLDEQPELDLTVDGADEIDPRWVEGRKHIGVTAGASAPDVLIQGVLDRLRALGASGVRELDGEPESMVFALPKELRVQLVD